MCFWCVFAFLFLEMKTQKQNECKKQNNDHK